MSELRCSICDEALAKYFDATFASNYPNLVCRGCDGQAVNAAGNKPEHNAHNDFGDNPVFVHGVQCWRRYRLGGYITMRDVFGCETSGEFHERNFHFGGR